MFALLLVLPEPYRPSWLVVLLLLRLPRALEYI
jgi:hypothetical protein